MLSGVEKTVPVAGAGGTGASAYQDWLTLPGNAGKSKAQFLATLKGADGLDGKDGAGTIGTRTAAQAIPASTFVVDNGDGTCSIADPNNAAHRGRVLGLVAAATAPGATATFQREGAALGVAGTFEATDVALYIGDGVTGRLGSIVNARPSPLTAAWVQFVGTPAAAAAVNLLLGQPQGLRLPPVMVTPTAPLLLCDQNNDLVDPVVAFAGALPNLTYPTMAVFLAAPIPAVVACVTVLGRDAPGDTAPMTWARCPIPIRPKAWHVQSAALAGGVVPGPWWQLAMPTQYVEPLMFGDPVAVAGKSVSDYAPIIQAALDYHPAVGELPKVRLGRVYANLSRGLRCPYPNAHIEGAQAGSGVFSQLIMGLNDASVFDAPLLVVGRRSKAMRVVLAAAANSGATQITVDRVTDDEGNTIAKGNAVTGALIQPGTVITDISGNTLTLSLGLTAAAQNTGLPFVVQTAFTAQVVADAQAGATSLTLSAVDDGYGAGLVQGDPLTGSGIAPGTTVVDVTGTVVTLSAGLTAAVPIGTTVSAILPFISAVIPELSCIGFQIPSAGMFRGGLSDTNGGVYDAATSTGYANRLASGNGRLLKLVGAQGHLVRKCAFERGNIQIEEHGCAFGTYDGCRFNGTWDHMRPGFQETIASFKIVPHVDGAIPTLPSFPNTSFGWLLAAPPRAVTVGTYTSNPAAAPGTAGSRGCYENIGPQYALWVQECEGLEFNPRYVGGQNVHCVFIDPRGMICNSIKIAPRWIDGARLMSVRVANTYVGVWCNDLHFAPIGRITGGDCDDGVLRVDQPVAGNPCTVGTLLVGDLSTDSHRGTPFQIMGALKATFGIVSLGSYNDLRGYDGSDINCAAILIGGTTDAVVVAGLNAGGAANDPSGSNGCKWGVVVINSASVKIGASLAYNMGVPNGGISNVASS